MPEHPSERLGARIDYVSSNYFETVGMSMAAGRGFTSDDREDTPRVAVVNETLARSRVRTGWHDRPADYAQYA